MKKSQLIAALRDVPGDADIFIAMGAGEGSDNLRHDVRYRSFPGANQAWYRAGARWHDVDIMAVSDYDTTYNAAWLEL